MEKIADVILEMAQRGQEKIDAQQREREKADEERVADQRRAWTDLQSAYRLAFAEEVREFVNISAAQEEDPRCWPGEKAAMTAFIKIPGFAPVAVFARRDENWIWTQEKRLCCGSEYYYEIPRPENDYEHGIIWNWKYMSTGENDLERALAFAKEEGQARQEIEERFARMLAEREAAAEAVKYVPVEEHNGLLNELVAFIRDVANEQIDARSKG